MKYWEFLIQKEGDDTWLPLETQQVEILEGRYRVVAHTDRINTPMEIRVSQLITQELPPRKRVRRRRGETNDAGLVVVMPYVHLKPGQWDLVCTSLEDGESATDSSWQYQVQLQVFAPTEEDWSAEWPVPEDAPPVPYEDTPLIQAQAELQDNLQRQGQAIEPTAIASHYRITLRQQAFLARHNQAMTITGQVQALQETGQLQGISQLWLRLQNPETAEVIMEAHRPLSLDRLPADFKVKIQLPTSVKTRVVLGEVSLRLASVAPEGIAPEPAQVLSSTAFTITAGIDRLLDNMANRDPGEFEEEEALLTTPDDSVQGAVQRREPELISPVLNPTYTQSVPAVGVVLPPKLSASPSDLSHLEPVEPTISGIGYDTSVPALPDLPPTDSAPLIVSDPPVAPVAHEASLNATADAYSPNDDRAPTPAPNAQSSDAHSADIPPDEPPALRAPMVSQPAQFMGTSIEEDDLEASQIAALLDDIDGDLASQMPTMDELEPPGLQAALPEVQPARLPHLDLPRSTRVPEASQPSTAINQTALNGNESTKKLEENGSQQAPEEKPEEFLTRAERQRRAQQRRQQEASVAFKSLKLKDHFWQRLSNLTHESHEAAAQLAENMRAAGVTPSAQSAQPLAGNIPEENISAENIPTENIPDLPANREVVIFNEPSVPSPVPAQPPLPAPATSKGISSEASAPGLSANTGLSANKWPPLDPLARRQHQTLGGSTAASTGSVGAAGSPFSRQSTPDEALPEMALPVISVPVGDLVAGETVTVTVRSQPSVYKPFIKLWMIDRQSRTIVGEPKLLTNLKPDALGYLETSAELRVPMGCLDVQIAAIAVDMATQQESNKAIVNRHVVPSRQSPSSMRNFNF